MRPGDLMFWRRPGGHSPRPVIVLRVDPDGHIRIADTVNKFSTYAPELEKPGEWLRRAITEWEHYIK